MSGISAAFRGNLTSDPEVKDAGSGRVAKFTVAVDDGYRGKDGEWVENPSLFVNVETWGGVADGVKALSSGDAVVVAGQWRATVYEVEGEKRRRQFVVAAHVGRDVYEKKAKKADDAKTDSTQDEGSDLWDGAR